MLLDGPEASGGKSAVSNVNITAPVDEDEEEEKANLPIVYTFCSLGIDPECLFWRSHRRIINMTIFRSFSFVKGVELAGEDFCLHGICMADIYLCPICAVHVNSAHASLCSRSKLCLIHIQDVST